MTCLCLTVNGIVAVAFRCLQFKGQSFHWNCCGQVCHLLQAHDRFVMSFGIMKKRMTSVQSIWQFQVLNVKVLPKMYLSPSSSAIPNRTGWRRRASCDIDVQGYQCWSRVAIWSRWFPHVSANLRAGINYGITRPDGRRAGGSPRRARRRRRHVTNKIIAHV